MDDAILTETPIPPVVRVSRIIPPNSTCLSRPQGGRPRNLTTYILVAREGGWLEGSANTVRGMAPAAVLSGQARVVQGGLSCLGRYWRRANTCKSCLRSIPNDRRWGRARRKLDWLIQHQTIDIATASTIFTARCDPSPAEQTTIHQIAEDILLLILVCDVRSSSRTQTYLRKRRTRQDNGFDPCEYVSGIGIGL